jgi:REP element-mobilizing transposase RayT
LLWGTKYRRRFLKEYVKEEFIKVIDDLLLRYPTLFIGAINTDESHVHIEIDIRPNIAVSSVV